MQMKTKRRRKSKKPADSIGVRGFFRIRVTEGDLNDPASLKVTGDSGVDADGNLINGDGLLPNLVTAAGFQQFLALTLAGSAGSKTVSHMGVGTGGAPASNDTTLSGEITHNTNCRVTVAPTTAASGAGYNVSFAAAFNSSASFLTASANLSNVGLFNVALSSNSATQGTVFAGNTYASSAVATNNNLQITYAIKFS